MLDIETCGIVGVELCEDIALDIAVGEVFVVVEVAVISRDTVEIAFIDSFGTFLIREKGFIQLLAMTDADDFDVFFLATEEFADSLGLALNCTSWRFLDKDITAMAMLESIENKVDGFVERHDESGHLWLGDGDGVTFFNLGNP